ncbi:DUF4136 domain-containing protein [Psychroflexus sp. CAK8W]|uniref:DUF4136 domain-containing protein n=1 Tax=Psychroflexus longus TaxID=2873596 RepID=A0ABS7XHV4_9FLAO|nr:DUF4136 domain-containing protein [Psychroflexus longus]MBZ9777587.1 DUF4136 domain-containing protein [Psychroflexus longus]
MKLLKNTLPIILGFLLFGCGASDVQTVRPNKADLSKYETFAYLPNASIEIRNSAVQTDFLNSFIIETINEQMKATGYTLDRDNPDLLVLISITTDLKTKRQEEPVYASYPYNNSVAGMPVSPFYQPFYYRGWYDWYYPGGVIGYTTDTYSYKKGTVVVDLVDRETKQSVWKGITSEPIMDQSETEAVQESIRDIFQKYPLNNK